MLAIVGHDLKSPLRSAGYAIERAHGDCSPEAQARLDSAKGALAQIDRDLNKLLVLATSAESRGGPKLEVFALAEVLDPLVATWRTAASRKGLTLDYVRSGLATESHRELLATIVGNLLNNAVKYAKAGRILIGIRRQPGAYSIDILDTGIGIPAEQQDAMFEAFRQGHASNDGLGLGLWIVSRSASMLGHTITMTSRPGYGTRFRVGIGGAR